MKVSVDFPVFAKARGRTLPDEPATRGGVVL
jgi:hypothetical protein